MIYLINLNLKLVTKYVWEKTRCVFSEEHESFLLNFNRKNKNDMLKMQIVIKSFQKNVMIDL